MSTPSPPQPPKFYLLLSGRASSDCSEKQRKKIKIALSCGLVTSFFFFFCQTLHKLSLCGPAPFTTQYICQPFAALRDIRRTLIQRKPLLAEKSTRHNEVGCNIPPRVIGQLLWSPGALSLMPLASLCHRSSSDFISRHSATRPSGVFLCCRLPCRSNTWGKGGGVSG